MSFPSPDLEKKDMNDDTAVLPDSEYTSKLHNDIEKPKRSNFASAMDVLVSGAALWSDGYNIQISAYSNLILAQLYPKLLTTTMKTRLSNSILIGDVFGMIIFGVSSDYLGRRFGIFACTFFLILGITIATAASGSGDGFLWMMVIGRGVAGLGAGGEYSVCTAAAIEVSEDNAYTSKNKTFLVAIATNFAIITGFLGAGIISLIILAGFHGKSSDAVWRVMFGVGIALPLIIFGFRLRALNSTTFQKNKVANKKKFPYVLAIKRYWKPFLGVSMAWLIYDIVVYPFNLLAPTIVTGFGTTTLYESVGYAALVNGFAIPGSFFGAFASQRFGAKKTYAWGFLVCAIVAFAIGGGMVPLRAKSFAGFVVLYGLFQSFLSVGPGNNNFLVSSQSFPTSVRGHFLGFSAALGKVGAAIGTSAFPLIQAHFSDTIKGQQAIFLVGAAFCFVGSMVVFFGVPDIKSDAELEVEDREFREYLRVNGWDMSTIGVGSEGSSEKDEEMTKN